MSLDNDEQIKTKIQQVFVNPNLQRVIVDEVVHNKPKGWGRKANAPYYTEVCGEQMKAVFDGMDADRTDRVYSLHEFPHMNLNSLYLRVNQSIRYLLEQMDTVDKKYARLKSMMRIKKERTVGIRIEFIPEFRNSNVSDFKPIAVIAKEETPIWKDELDDYLENGAVGKPFMRDKLALTADEIRDLKISFAGLKNVMSSITAHSIKVIKTNNV